MLDIKCFKNLILISLCLSLFACKNNTNTEQKPVERLAYDKIETKGEMVADLTAPPFVPKPVGNRPAMKLKVSMEIVEKEAELSDGVRYVFWTFGGSVPGSFIRGRVGDEVEFTLKNHPDNKLPHNIDLHAVTGQGGGAEASFVAPGHEKVFGFKLINPGLYVYHCATAPVGMHIANGMYGLILVEPEGGLPPVDKEFYVMQGDFYTKNGYGQAGLQPFDMKKAIKEDADYVVFNGRVGSLTGDNALKANVGETIRLFVGNGGPNIVSSFHVIGEVFDKVYVEGGDLINENIQTTLIPAGGSAIVDFKVEVPSTLILVDHSIFRAFNKGALGMLKVSGEKNPKVFSGEILEGIYHPEGDIIQEIDSEPVAQTTGSVPPMTKAEKLKLGKQIYDRSCFACHQPDGKGMADAFPPLANSDYLNADTDRAISAVIHGLSGEVTVNGNKYNSVMPAQILKDEEVASVLTYIYNSWGNNQTEVSPEQVSKLRKR